jgi:hypothetical protein
MIAGVHVAKRRTLAQMTFAGVVAFAMAGACGSHGAAVSDVRFACPSSKGAKPRASIGPDVKLEVVCGQTVSGAIASVSNSEGGTTTWSVSLAGDSSFSLEQGAFATCAGMSPSVAIVIFTPPTTAALGDSFDTVATVRADDGSFPSGTVAVHATVIALTATVEPTVLELGEVAPGQIAEKTLTFHAAPGASAIQPSDFAPFSFHFAGSRTNGRDFAWNVTALSSTPGDYMLLSQWTVGLKPGALPPACDWHVNVPIHVRVLDPATRDGGADAVDAADAADAPEAAP